MVSVTIHITVDDVLEPGVSVALTVAFEPFGVTVNELVVPIPIAPVDGVGVGFVFADTDHV
jgi:hypothetical protein